MSSAGFKCFAAGCDWLTADVVSAFPDMTLHPGGPEPYAWAGATVFAGHTAREADPDLLAIAERRRPDLIVREAAEYGGTLAAELLEVPRVGADRFRQLVLVAAPACGRIVDAARAHLGLPLDPDTIMPFRDLQLSLARPASTTPPTAGPTCVYIRPPDAPPKATVRCLPGCPSSPIGPLSTPPSVPSTTPPQGF